MPLSLTLFAIVCALLSSVVALMAGRQASRLRYFTFFLLGLTGVSAGVGGIWVLLNGTPVTIQLPSSLAILSWHLRIDALAGLFITIVGLITFAVSVYGPSYVYEFSRGPYSLAVLGTFTGLFIASLLLVLIADDAWVFMLAWEMMSLTSYFLVVYQHLQPANRRAAFIYLLLAHVGGIAILFAFGILASFGNGFSFEALRHAPLSLTWASITFGLGVFGFGMKAGLVPLHAWLPEAHPVAPSHISALMSGVMLKVAIYGLIRLVFDLLGMETLHWSWGVILVAIGSLSAVTGILYALMQNDLKRLLAYSSIENIGIITLGLGLSLLFISNGHTLLGVLSLIAALYHTLNHAIFKSLLFLSAGAVLHATHERDLERMGGLGHRLPYTAFFFLSGCLAISALPPFNGFVSEWLIFQAGLQAPVLESGVLRALVPVSAALLALTSALSAACFVKVYGVAFLGQPRTEAMRTVHEVSWGMRLAQGILASLCLLLGIFPTTLIATIEAIPKQLIGTGLASAQAEGWIWLTPIAAEVASYSALLVLLSIAAVWGIVFMVLRSTKKTRYTRPWECGFGTPTPRMQYTATAFVMPMRRVFQPVWRLEERIDEVKDPKTLASSSIRYQLHIADRAWPILYEPVVHAVAIIGHHLSYLQTGHIRTYLAYSFFTLLLLLWLIT